MPGRKSKLKSNGHTTEYSAQTQLPLEFLHRMFVTRAMSYKAKTSWPGVGVLRYLLRINFVHICVPVLQRSSLGPLLPRRILSMQNLSKSANKLCLFDHCTVIANDTGFHLYNQCSAVPKEGHTGAVKKIIISLQQLLALLVKHLLLERVFERHNNIPAKCMCGKIKDNHYTRELVLDYFDCMVQSTIKFSNLDRRQEKLLYVTQVKRWEDKSATSWTINWMLWKNMSEPHLPPRQIHVPNNMLAIPPHSSRCLAYQCSLWHLRPQYATLWHREHTWGGHTLSSCVMSIVH